LAKKSQILSGIRQTGGNLVGSIMLGGKGRGRQNGQLVRQESTRKWQETSYINNFTKS